MLSRAVAAAAVAYSIISLIYGQAEYAAVGSVEFDTSWIETLIPAIAAIAYPLLSKFVPGWSIISKTLSWVLPKPDADTPAVTRHLLQLIREINALEEQAAKAGNIDVVARCGVIRTGLIADLMDCNETPDKAIDDAIDDAIDEAGDTE